MNVSDEFLEHDRWIILSDVYAHPCSQEYEESFTPRMSHPNLLKNELFSLKTYEKYEK